MKMEKWGTLSTKVMYISELFDLDVFQAFKLLEKLSLCHTECQDKNVDGEVEA